MGMEPVEASIGASIAYAEVLRLQWSSKALIAMGSSSVDMDESKRKVGKQESQALFVETRGQTQNPNLPLTMSTAAWQVRIVEGGEWPVRKNGTWNRYPCEIALTKRREGRHGSNVG